MSATLDPRIFVQNLVDPLKKALDPLVQPILNDAGNVAALVLRLEKDIHESLDAMAKTPSDRLRDLIREDLEKFFPARRAALVAMLEAKAGSDIQAAAERAFDVIATAAVAAARAYVRSMGIPAP